MLKMKKAGREAVHHLVGQSLYPVPALRKWGAMFLSRLALLHILFTSVTASDVDWIAFPISCFNQLARMQILSITDGVY